MGVKVYPPIQQADVVGLPEALALNDAHRANVSNPHSVLKSQVGLSEVQNVNIPANWGNAKNGYMFDGVDDRIATEYIAPAIANQSVSIWFNTSAINTRMFMFADINSGGAVATTRLCLSIEAANEFGFYLGDGTNTWFTQTSVSSLQYQDGKDHHAVLVISGLVISGTDIKLYIDNVLVTTQTSTVALGTAGTNYFYIGRLGSKSQNYFKGFIYGCRIFTRALTVADVAKEYNNGLITSWISYSDKNASNTIQTSGSLIIGKRYLISTYADGDSFTNVGTASNASGVEFVATGTTPTTWTNGSALYRIGCVLDLDMDTAGNVTVADKSGNGYHGSVTGAVPISRAAKMPAIRQAITGNVVITNAIPRGYKVSTIYVKNNNGTNGVSLRGGTTANGTELFGDTTINAGETLPIQVNKSFSLVSDLSAYFYGSGTGLNLDVTMSLEREMP